MRSCASGMSLRPKRRRGNSALDLNQTHPIAMLAGGIGVTPMISMINALCQSGSKRDVYFAFALRHGGDHVFKDHLRSVAARCPNIRMHVLYENPRTQDVPDHDYARVGRIDGTFLREMLPSLEMEYYLCGPGGMMDAVSRTLANEGIAREKIKTESFGPSSLAFRAALADADRDCDAETPQGFTVTFGKSGKTVPWANEAATLLELAEMNGVDISFGCRYGDCGTCMTRLVRGRVKYLHPTDVHPDPGTCLPCSCKPETDIELDA